MSLSASLQRCPKAVCRELKHKFDTSPPCGCSGCPNEPSYVPAFSKGYACHCGNTGGAASLVKTIDSEQLAARAEAHEAKQRQRLARFTTPQLLKQLKTQAKLLTHNHNDEPPSPTTVSIIGDKMVRLIEVVEARSVCDGLSTFDSPACAASASASVASTSAVAAAMPAQTHRGSSTSKVSHKRQRQTTTATTTQ